MQAEASVEKQASSQNFLLCILLSVNNMNNNTTHTSMVNIL